MELLFSCGGSNVNGRSPENGSAVTAQILRFTQRARQLNVSGGRISPLAEWKGEDPGLWETAVPSIGGSEDLLLRLRDARPTEDFRKGSTYNSSLKNVLCNQGRLYLKLGQEHRRNKIKETFRTQLIEPRILIFIKRKQKGWRLRYSLMRNCAAWTAVFSVTAHTCFVSGSDHVISERMTARASMALSRRASPSTPSAAWAYRPALALSPRFLPLIFCSLCVRCVLRSAYYNEADSEAKPRNL